MRSSFLNFICVCAASVAFAKSYTPTQIHDTEQRPTLESSVITPSVSPIIQHGFDVFITADFLYWTARVDNLDYAQTGITQIANRSNVNHSTNFNAVPTEGVQWHPNHQFNPGFKVGLGFNINHDGWDLYFQYTWLRSKASSHNTFTTPATSLWSYSSVCVYGPATTSINEANDSWRLHFNTLDFELGRNFFISPRLLLRPHFGLKGSWQRQHHNINLLALTDQNASGTITTGNYAIHQRQYFWGLGIRSGLNTSWQFTRNWSVFGDCALAALWGQFTNHRYDTTSQTSSSSAITQFTQLEATNMRKRVHTITPVLEMDLGFRWDYWFSDDDYRFRIQASWEEQVWFDQNQFIDLNSWGRDGNLTTQGLTVDFRLDF